MTRISTLIVLLTAAIAGDPQSFEESSNSLDKLFKEFVGDDGMVDYHGISRTMESLNLYLSFIEKVSPITNPELFVTKDDKISYWINAYNALVLKTMLDFPMALGIRDIPLIEGVFWRKRFVVGDQRMSLNGIEHGILRRKYKDPRIHFAINCASISCPPLHNNIFRAESLDRMLDERARVFLNDPKYIRIDHGDRTIYISKIFRWFKKDFTNQHGTIQNYIYQFLYNQDERVLDYKVRYLRYSWLLNSSNKSEY